MHGAGLHRRCRVELRELCEPSKDRRHFWRSSLAMLPRSTLIEAYQHEYYSMDLPDPVEAIKFRLEQEGKDSRALIGVIGQRTRVYEVLRGKRSLSLNMIRAARQVWHPANVLIQPGRNRRKSAGAPWFAPPQKFSREEVGVEDRRVVPKSTVQCGTRDRLVALRVLRAPSQTLMDANR